MNLLKIQEPIKENSTSNDVKQIVIGIDLGTTNSLVGIVENDIVKLFSDEKNQQLHKSIVAFDEAGNVVAVGNKADEKNYRYKISSIKRLMGKNFDEVKNNHDFNFDEESAKSGIVRLVVGEKKYLPEEISAEILKYLKNLALENLHCDNTLLQELYHPPLEGGSKSQLAGDSRRGDFFMYDSLQKESLVPQDERELKAEILKAVITVPAYFDEAAKNATKLAAKLAGLEVLRLVNEPTAAALAYGLDNKTEGIYVVYDLGGGTFDVSILKMQKGVFKVLGVNGNRELGGDDFDKILIDLTKKKTGIDIDKNSAKKIKEEFFSCAPYKINTPHNLNTPHPNPLPQGERGSDRDTIPQDERELSKTEFEEAIAPKIDETINLTKKLIEDLELETGEIKGVVMVGGSSRIPSIHKKLAEIFGQEKVLTNLDPDRVVAFGAAWQAYNLSGNNQNLLLDVIPLSLGIEMMGGIVDKIVHRNSTIPIAMKKEFTTYADNQTGIKFNVVQGEREFAKDCRQLAEFEVKNIPAMRAGLARVEVVFKIDADGLLTIDAQEKITKQSQTIIVKPSYGLDENEIKKMLLDSMKNAKEDIALRLRMETIREANQNIDFLKRDLKLYANLIDEQEKNNIEKTILNLKQTIKENKTRDEIIAAQKDMEKASENFVLNKMNKSLEYYVSKKIDEI